MVLAGMTRYPVRGEQIPVHYLPYLAYRYLSGTLYLPALTNYSWQAIKCIHFCAQDGSPSFFKKEGNYE